MGDKKVKTNTNIYKHRRVFDEFQSMMVLNKKEKNGFTL
jgi:hypothetical protein